MSDHIFILIFSFLLFAAAVIFIIIIVSKQRSQHLGFHKTTVRAKILSKRKEERVSFRPHGVISHKYRLIYYWVKFQTEDGKEIELFVKKLEYPKFKIGSFGELTFWGAKLLKFKTK